jgi:hypothetical protein
MTTTESPATIQLHALRIAVINYAAEQAGWSFDPRLLSAADVDSIGDVMVNDDGALDVHAVTMLATLRVNESDDRIVDQ